MIFIVNPGIVLLDLVGPLQVFTHAYREGAETPAYQTHIASLDGGKVQTNTIVEIDSASLSHVLNEMGEAKLDTLVIVGGNGAEIAAHMRATDLFDVDAAVS